MSVAALVQGCSRGIGLQFCRMLLSRSPDLKLVATCRSPDTANDLQELKNSVQDRLHILPLDITNETQIKVPVLCK